MDPRLPAGQRIGQEDAGPFRPVIRQRRVQCLHGEPDPQVCDDEGGGHNLEAEHPLRGGLLHPRPCECTEAPAIEVGGDAAQRLGQECAGAAAGIEDVDVVRRQPVLDAEVVLQRHINAGYHVADHLGWGVPDTELLAQGRIEGLQERLVEIGHGLALVKPGEEGVPVHSVECC